MKNILLLIGALTIISHDASAHIWRVNSDATKSPDFTTINDAIAAATAGDTIQVEPSAMAYPTANLNKRLVLLGNGYFLHGSNLQANQDSSFVISINVDSSAVNANGSGSFISGISAGSISLLHNVHDVTITRCHLTGQLNITAFDRDVSNLLITQNFLESFITSAFLTSQVTVTIEYNIFSIANGIGGATVTLNANVTGLFRNNTINTNNNAITLNNFYIANNVFISAATNTLTGNNNVIRNNSFAAPTFTNVTDGVDGNHTNVNMSTLFAGSTSAGYGDSRFQTAGPGALRGTGESILGITPDRGAYNTVNITDSYRTSGIPFIPTISKLTVPASVDPAAATIDITVSAHANN